MHDLGSSFPNATGHPDGRDEYMPVEECGNMLILGLALVHSLKYDTEPTSIWSQTWENPLLETSSSSSLPLYIDTEGIDETFGGPVNAKGEKQARKWIEKSYCLWKKWTSYLVREALIPANQLSTDDFAGWLANQTNLALKGIIGIRAMSEISELVGEKEDAKFLRGISESYVKRWNDEFAFSRDGTHAKLAYTWYGSWTTLYNLFADSLLCFHIPSGLPHVQSMMGQGQSPLQPAPVHRSKTAFVDEKVYKLQSDWYHTVRQRYGLPLDNRSLLTKSDWQFFAVAMASKSVREEVVQSIALWVNETSTGMWLLHSNARSNVRPQLTALDSPLTDLYNTEGDGGYPGIAFKARPVVGGHFAFVALDRACSGRHVLD